MEWLWPCFSYWFGEWLPKTLATYQTLIASVIALCAVVGGAMLNARFNRKQQDRIRHQDAVALAAMFAADMNMLGMSAEAMVRQLAIIEDSVKLIVPEEKRQWSTWVRFVHEQTRFEKLSERLGLLGPDLSLKVSSFYALYFDVSSKLADFKSAELTAKDAARECAFLKGALQRLRESGITIVQQLLAFAYSKKLPDDSANMPSWLKEQSNRKEAGI